MPAIGCFRKNFQFKADRTRMNLDPQQFIPGLDISMMYREMYWAAEGYLWERCNVDMWRSANWKRVLQNLQIFGKAFISERSAPVWML